MKFTRSALMASSLLALALVPATANAAPTIWSGAGANDSVNFGQLGNSFTLVNSGAALTSAGALGVTFTTGSGGQAQRRDQGNGWGGNFANGATLLWNQGRAGDLLFTFASPVRGVGAQFQANFFGPFTARVTTNDGSFFDLPGVSNSNGNNSAIFIGVQNTIANITSIRFHEQAGGGNNDFAIGNLSLLTGGIGVPEPSSWALMIVGFGAVGGAMRTRRSKLSVRFAG